ncbi:MAG: hypothetical protein ACK5N8_01640 [Alphaproteobacteria bacterium]
MNDKSSKVVMLLKLIIALFITYYSVEDISNMFIDEFDPTFSMALYIVSNVFMFLLAWSMVFKEIDKIKMSAFVIFVLISALMSFYSQEVTLKLNKSDCFDAGKSWDTEDNRCRYDCTSWTKDEGCAKAIDAIDEEGLDEK